jgi:hypothetical protein
MGTQDDRIRNVVKEKVKNILIGYVGGCTCDRAFYERNLNDPSCVACYVGMDDGELVGELVDLIMKERTTDYF